ncbi:BTAD domain-containing putative transcriptional regulator [Kitasatospora sp. GP30]|uniref:AfsR/SARP family transcriptional regulator n=1 Tax=Kitasatospora sp. GP30 TaxID=3035084 RepID=UPI000CC42043|nr:BTAD domain-containing putative transcriptional regulator [Kitasatospora sp. GP30]
MDELRFCVLGRMLGERGGVPVVLGSPQQRAVLAVLLLTPGHTASTSDLIDALWPDDPPSHARTTVRTYVWRLRRSLAVGAEPVDQTEGRLSSVPGGYHLDVPTGCVDALRAERLVAEAGGASAGGAPERARALLGEALALWQGEPLVGIPGPFAARQRSRLGDLRLTLLEERVALDIALGRAALCVSELTALTQEFPLRERFHELLMRALCQAGRQTEALEVFRSARRLLVRELGVEPGRDLAALHGRILDGDPELTGRAPAVRPGGGSGAPTGPGEPEPTPDPERPDALPRPAQLPPDDADFTGREAAVEALCAALTAAAPGRDALRIGAVAGMGGVGKTALAVHVAHRVKEHFPAGQLYADLRGDGGPVTPEAVLTAFLRALGTAPEALPDGLAAKSALFRSLTDGRRLLVVLDNAVDSAQIRPLLPGAAGCAVLVTSRAWLAGLPGARQIGLTVFAPQEAQDLLERMIGAERLAGESAAALELVTACGFLPLAVRIVAARLAARPSWTVRVMVDRLSDERRRLDELRVGDLAVQATFELGYRQLTPYQVRAFRLVAAVDCKDLGTAAAAALLGLDEHIADELLESLADVAMLESPAAGRYRSHELLRAFARRKSEAGHPADTVAGRTRLLEFQLATACAAFEQVVPGDPIRDALDLRAPGPAFAGPEAARSWAAQETDSLLSLATQVATAVAGRPPGEQQATEELHAAVGLLIALTPFNRGAWQGQWAAARALLQAAERRADRWAEGRARFLCGNAALAAARLDEAEQLTRSAAQACRETGDTVILRQSLNDLGMMAQYRGHYDEAARCYDEAILLARALGHETGESATVFNAAVAWVRSGQPDRAVRACLGELDKPRLRTAGAGRAQALYVLGFSLHASQRYDEAAERLSEALALWTGLDQTGWVAATRYRLADTLRALGRAEEALPLARAAVEACQEGRSERESGQALMVLGRVLSALGRRAEALDCVERAHGLFARLGLPEERTAAAQLAAGEPDLSAY